MIPYTYHLYHKPTDQHYYGARYGKGCKPGDLWVSYFSSSPVVHDLIEQYGRNSFVPTVRKIFTTAHQAVEWEAKFLSKINAQFNDKWLNRHNGKARFVGPHTQSSKTKSIISEKLTGIKRSDETKTLMSIAAKKREAKRRESGWTMPKDSIEQAISTRKKRIASGEINPYSDERNRKMGASKKGKKRKYLPDGSFIMVDPQELQ